jgi:DNA (cytosine-5)-methyltransferase 1
LVAIASKDGELAPPIKWDANIKTVRDAISHLPPIKAGIEHPEDKLHKSSALNSINQKRIRASKQGGTWRDWPKELIADCHKKKSGKTYPSVYGRMSWDKPAPTMTTQCFGFGNGRFGHPEQDRAISLREAAALQSFPDNYEFVPKNEKITMKEVGKWIGNAVPVKLAEAVALGIQQHESIKDA